MVVKAVSGGTFVPSDGAVVEDGDTVTVEAGSASANGTVGITGGAIDQVTLATNAAILLDQQSSVNINQYDGTGSFAATVGVAANAPTFTLANATTRIVVDALPVTVRNSNGLLPVSGTIGISGGALTGIALVSTATPVNNGQVITGLAPTGTYTSQVTFSVANGIITGIVLS